MPLPVIAYSDFIGWIKISANTFKQGFLQEYIDDFLDKYLSEVIGDDAFSQIQDDSVPLQKWTDLIEGRMYTDSSGIVRKWEGLTGALKKFIYFEFIRDNFTNTQVGKVKPNNENSENVGNGEIANIARSRYNSASMVTRDPLNSYLEAFNELSEEITSFIDNSDDTYTINVASTEYLYDGDTVTIDNVEYVVSNVVVNTSFGIDAGQIGLSYSGASSWKPYEDVLYCPISAMTI